MLPEVFKYFHTMTRKNTYQYIGRYSTSPGPTTVSNPWASLNKGNFSKSGSSKSTCWEKYHGKC